MTVDTLLWVLSSRLYGTLHIFINSVSRPKKMHTVIYLFFFASSSPLGQATLQVDACKDAVLQLQMQNLAKGCCCYHMSRDEERILLPIHKISFSWCSLLHFLSVFLTAARKVEALLARISSFPSPKAIDLPQLQLGKYCANI